MEFLCIGHGFTCIKEMEKHLTWCLRIKELYYSMIILISGDQFPSDSPKTENHLLINSILIFIMKL